MENWKDIPGFSDYEISDAGTIRSKERVKKFKNGREVKFLSKEKRLRTHPQNGFLMTDLIDDKGQRKTVYPHKAVALAFLVNKKPKENKVVVHLDGNFQNNHISNLKWTNFSESIKMGFESGKRDNSQLWFKRRLKYGMKGGNTSSGRPDPLDYIQKKRIVFLREVKNWTLKQLADKYNCSVSHIHNTVKNWKEKSLSKVS